MEEFTHILISRFSIRMHENEGFRGRSTSWLFDEDRLELKLRLLEHVALASIAGGTAQPDLYMVLMDKDLPQSIRAKLEFLASQYPWVHLHSVGPGALMGMRDLGGLVGHLNIQSPYILTTNLDDDDALSDGFIGGLQQRAGEFIKQRPNAPFHWFGSTEMYEWDMVSEGSAPMGFSKPFSGNVNHVLSTGYSVLSKNYDFGPTVFTLSHNRCLDFLSATHKRAKTKSINRIRFKINLARKLLSDFKICSAVRFVFSTENASLLNSSEGSNFMGLIVNHGDNLQNVRITLGTERRAMLNEMWLKETFNVAAKKAFISTP